MNFIKTNILSIVGVTLYFVWWVYLVFVFGEKEYDNGFAGAIASEAMAGLTIIIILVFLACFLTAGFRTGSWRKYAIFIALILAPAVILIGNVIYNIDSYKPVPNKSGSISQ